MVEATVAAAMVEEATVAAEAAAATAVATEAVETAAEEVVEAASAAEKAVGVSTAVEQARVRRAVAILEAVQKVEGAKETAAAAADPGLRLFCS